ncbi:MAG: hypothetical protein ACOCWQ_00220 [Nanoarchaeota archaeon]
MDHKGMPVFVKVDEYKDVLDLMNMVKTKLGEAKNILNHLNELKNEEDAELESWKLNIDDISKKVEFIDNTLFEPEKY